PYAQEGDPRRRATTARVERHHGRDPYQRIVAVAARQFEERRPTPGEERRDGDFHEQLARLERRLEQTLEELARGDRALARRAPRGCRTARRRDSDPRAPQAGPDGSSSPGSGSGRPPAASRRRRARRAAPGPRPAWPG